MIMIIYKIKNGRYRFQLSIMNANGYTSPINHIYIRVILLHFRYYVKRRGEVVIASYDGEKYTGCRPSDEVAGAIVVPFDNHGGKLGIGTLKVKRVYDIVDADMADGVFNSVTEKVLPVELWRGPSDDVAGDAVIVYDSLYRGRDGKSAYEIWLEQGNEGSEQDFLDSLKGDKMTYDDLTEEEKDDLASRVKVHEVDLSEYAKKSEVPTKTSELTNDSGFVTSEELATAISQSITNALNTEV
jgi:hypothetical protein